MKIRHEKNKSYNGDNSGQIQYLHENGQWQGLFNIYRKNGYYENCSYSGTFKTITEAKNFAKTLVNKEG